MKKLVFFAAAAIFIAPVFACPAISVSKAGIHPQETAKPVNEKQQPVKGKKGTVKHAKIKKANANAAEAPVKKAHKKAAKAK